MNDTVIPTSETGEPLPAYMLPLIKEYVAKGKPEFSDDALQKSVDSFNVLRSMRAQIREDVSGANAVPSYTADWLPPVEAKRFKRFHSTVPRRQEILADYPVDSLIYQRRRKVFEYFVHAVLWRSVAERFNLPYVSGTSSSSLSVRTLGIIFGVIAAVWAIFLSVAFFFPNAAWIIPVGIILAGFTALHIVGSIINGIQRVRRANLSKMSVKNHNQLTKYLLECNAIFYDNENQHVSVDWEIVRP